MFPPIKRGENGSGKSTLVKSLLGLKGADRGKIIYGDGLKKNEMCIRDRDRAELVIVTEKVKEKHMGSALCELKEMKSIFEVSSMIREY